jgi:hypothetical protein
MPEQKGARPQPDAPKQPGAKQPANAAQSREQPKPESSSEYEGAPSRKPTGNRGAEVKTETSSSSGQ